MQPFFNKVVDFVGFQVLRPVLSAFEKRGLLPDFNKIRTIDISRISGSFSGLDALEVRLYKLFERAKPGVRVAKEAVLPPCLKALQRPVGASVPLEESQLVIDRELIQKYSLLGRGASSSFSLLSLEGSGIGFLLSLLEGHAMAGELRAALEAQERFRRSGVEEVEGIAAEYPEKLKGLEAGKSLLVFSGVAGKKAELKLPALSNEPLVKTAQRFLLEDTKAEELAKMILAKASPELEKVLKNEDFLQGIKWVLQKKETFALGSSLTKGASFWKRVLLTPAEWIRQWAENRAKKSSDDLFNEISKRLSFWLTPELQQELYRVIMSDTKVVPNLESFFKKQLEEKLELAKREATSFIPKLGEALPSFLRQLMSYMNFGSLGQTEKFFCYDFEKQRDGRITLTLYRPLNGPESVIGFKDLNLESLDAVFFHRLLSYQTDPNYSVEDIENHFLASLGTPQAIGEKDAALHGSDQAGVLYVYAAKKGVDLEKTHFFATRDAFIELWHHEEKEKHLALLENKAMWLASRGDELLKRGKISELEFKQAFATSHEALVYLREKRDKKVPESQIFPLGFKEEIKQLLLRMGATQTNLYFVKSLLVEGLGAELSGEIESVIDVVEKELGELKTPPAKAMTEISWTLRGLASKVSVVAMQIFLLPQLVVARVVSFVAHKIFSSCFPETLRRWNEWKAHLLVKAMSTLFLTEKQRELCRDSVGSIKNLLLREGSLNFKVSKKERELEQVKLIPVRSALDYSPSQRGEPVSLHKHHLTHEKPPTPENMTETLLEWNKNASGMNTFEALLYLNSRLMLLPVPKREEKFWNEVKEVEPCMEAIAKVAFTLNRTLATCSYQQENQCILHLYTLFAICRSLVEFSEPWVLDKRSKAGAPPSFRSYDPLKHVLMRSLEMPFLGGSSSPVKCSCVGDAVGLINWSRQPHFQMVDSRASARLKELLQYYDVDDLAFSSNTSFEVDSGDLLSGLYHGEEGEERDIENLSTPIFKILSKKREVNVPASKLVYQNCQEPLNYYMFFDESKEEQILNEKVSLWEVLQAIDKDKKLERTLQEGLEFTSLWKNASIKVTSFEGSILREMKPEVDSPHTIHLMVGEEAKINEKHRELLNDQRNKGRGWRMPILNSHLPTVVFSRKFDKRLRSVMSGETLSTLLYVNPSVEDKLGYHGVLPLPFHLLRVMHQLCHQKIRHYDQKSDVRQVGTQNIYRSPFRIVEEDHKVRKRIRKLTLGMACRDRYSSDSILQYFPGRFTHVIGHHFNVQSPVRPKQEDPKRDFNNKLSERSIYLLDRAARKERKTQTQILNQGAESSNRLVRGSDLMQRQVGMVYSKGADEPVRILSLIQEDFSLLDNVGYRILLEFFFLREDLFRNQLAAHPEFLEAVDQFFKEAIASLKEREKGTLDLAFLWVLAHAEAETMGIKSKIDLLEEYGDDLDFALLAGVAYHQKEPKKCSKAEQKKIVHHLVKAKFLREVKKDSIYGIDYGEEKAIFEETWAIWRTCIASHIDKVLLESVCKMQGYDPALSNALWIGSYPYFRLGAYTIDFDKGRGNSKPSLYDGKIRRSLCSVVKDVAGLTLTPLKEGRILIPELEMSVEIDIANASFSFFRRWKGEKYQWVHKRSKEEETEAFVTHWLEVKSGSKMLRLENGKVSRFYRLKSVESKDWEERTATILSEEPLDDTEHLERVPFPAGLASLTWFQKREDIFCFACDLYPNQVRLIDFRKLNLKFEVTQENGQRRAMSRGAFPGFWIAKKQPNLTAYGRYLVLRNKEGERRVLLPANALAGASLKGLCKKFQFGESYFLQALAENYTPFTQKGYFVCSIDSRGNLDSADPEALFHLFFYHLASGSLKEVNFYLTKLEGVARIKELPQSLQQFNVALHTLAAASQSQELTLISLRMVALLEVNTHSYGKKSLGRENDLMTFLLTQFNYKNYIQQQASYLQQLSPFQELSIINTLTFLIKDQLEKFDSLSEHLYEYSVLPIITQRYRELLAKYAPQVSKKTPLMKRYLEAAASTSVFNPLGAVLGQPITNHSGLHSQGVEHFFIALNELKRVDNSFVILNEVIVPFEQLPTKFSEIDEAFLTKNFKSYYVLVYGKAPMGKEELFKRKTEELKRSLAYLQGANAHPYLQTLHYLFHSRFHMVLRAPEQLDEAYISGLVRLSLLSSFLSNLSSKVVSVIRPYFHTLAVTTGASLVGLGNIAATYHTGRTVFRNLRIAGQLYSSIPEEKGRSFTNDPLGKEQADRLMTIDQELERTFAHFQELYLEVSQTKNSSAKPLQITGDRVTDAHLRELNQSLRDYENRNPEEKAALKGSFEDLKRDLSTLSKLLTDLLEKEKQTIIQRLETSYHRATDDLEGLKGAAKTLEGRSIDFDALLIHFLKGEIESYRLNDEEATVLYQSLYAYLIYATRKQQIDRVIQQTDPDKAARELAQKRGYSFSGMPERIVRGHLLFEYKMDTLLWEKQTTQILEMLNKGETRAFVELIMGMGKTFYGIPMTDLFIADGKQLAINIWPAAMKRTNIDQIGRQVESAFSQEAYALSFSRSEKLTLEQLEGRLLIMLKSLREFGQINMSKEEAQALELIWLEQIHLQRAQGDKELDRRVELLTEIMRLIRTKGRASVDEAHEAFRRDQMLNHPIGKQKKLKESDICVLEEFARSLIDPEVLKIIDIRDNQRTWKPEVYQDLVRPLIAQRYCDYFEIPEKEREIFKEYLLGKSKKIPDFVRGHLREREICLARGLINVIAPKALSGIVSVNFGPSKKQKGKFAKPYSGNENPKEESTIQNPFEAGLKTFLQQITRRLTEEDALELITLLIAKAKKEGKLFDLPLSQTEAGKLFEKWCPGQTLEKYSCSKATKQLNEHMDAVLMHAHHFILPQISYFGRFFGSNSQNFASMFSGFVADTGTPSNDMTYPVGTKGTFDKGTSGEIVEFLLNRCSDSIHIISSTDPLQAAEEIITSQFSAKTRALIDCGALFRQLDNETLAKKMLKGSIEGVAFFNPDQKLVMWEKGGETSKGIEESRLPLEKRGAFFDDSHTFAADVPLYLEAEGLVTLGENTTLTRLAQAVWRMRGLKKGKQSIRILLNSKVKEMISGNEPCTMEQIIQFVTRNEAKQLAEDTFFADYQKITNAIRRVVLDRLLSASNKDERITVFNSFENELLNKMEDDPILLYGALLVDATPMKALETVKNQMMKGLAFTRDEIRRIEQELSQIGLGLYPDSVKVSLREGKMGLEYLAGLGMEQIESQEEQLESNQSQQVTAEQNIDQSLVSSTNAQYELLDPKPWNPEISYCKDLSWLKLSNLQASFEAHPNFYSLEDVLSQSDLPQLAQMRDAFKGNIWCSENFIGNIKSFFRTTLASSFSPQQKPILEVLITESNEGYSIGLLDQQDAAFWRATLLKDQKATISGQKIALFDIGLNSVVVTGKNRLLDVDLKKNVLFRRDIALIRFLKGSTHFSGVQLRSLKPWIKKHGPKKTHRLFTALHERFGISRKAGSSIDQLFIELQQE